MPRRLLVVCFVAAVVLSACGSGATSPSPQASEQVLPAVVPPPSAVPSPSEPAASAPATTTMSSACAGVSVRTEPSTGAVVLARLTVGTKVRVVETVNGDEYTVGNCGTSGDTWLKIDRVDGKKAKTQYGARYVYAAEGLFK